jgi:hypothetical protein
MSKKILVIPDVQCKPGVDMTHLTHIGKYIVEKKPDMIVHLGDHWDMPSLSSYDKGKKSFEGRRYKADIEAGNLGMRMLQAPLVALNKKKMVYNPERHFLFGNHEQRILRATNDEPMLDGTIGLHDCDTSGWITHPFLEVFVHSGIAFSHYFTTGVMGRPCTTAASQLSKKHMSCIAGHQQGLQIATANRADGASLTSLIVGSCYTHHEDYLGPQGNVHFRGIIMLHDVQPSGQFEIMPISLRYLKGKYHD